MGRRHHDAVQLALRHEESYDPVPTAVAGAELNSFQEANWEFDCNPIAKLIREERACHSSTEAKARELQSAALDPAATVTPKRTRE